MKNIAARAALLALAAQGLVACHARWNPLGSAPTIHYRQTAKDGVLNKRMEGNLSDEDAGYGYAFRYEIPSKGSLIITAKPVTPVKYDIDVYTEGTTPIATTKDGNDKKLQVQDVEPGTVYVLMKESWKEAKDTRFFLTTVFKPADPDEANGPYKSQAGAREIPADKGMVSDTVDYSAMRRTNFWKINVPGDGELQIKFNNNGNKLSAEIIPPSGAPEKIDPTVGYKKADLPGGDYFVKVTADDAGDAGKYDLMTSFKQGDLCKNSEHCSGPEAAEELKVPQDSKTAEVDYSKSKQRHWFKFTSKEKGKLTLAFKALDKGSKVQAFVTKNPEEDGERITGSSKLVSVDQPGDLYIRVVAPEAGDRGKFALQTIFQPDNFIAGELLEFDQQRCLITTNAGTNMGVRAGAGCTIVNQTGAALDTCVVDSAFPNLAKVKPLTPGCKVPRSNIKIQIQAQ